MCFRTSALLLAAVQVAYSRTLNALVYGDTTNNVTCDCADDLGTMIANTPGFDINYNIVGPDGTPFTDDLLNSADIFAYPGGPDVGRAWKGLEPHAPALRQWVADGGRFIGICLGAYLASSGTDFAPGDGLGLLPDNDSSGEETSQDGAQVTDPDTNTVVDIDWTWGSGSHAGQTVNNRTLFFQDGVVIYLSNPDSVKILGRYSSNGDIAVTVSPYGKGWVGVSGVHVEANKSWYQDANFTNPQGIDPDYGYDLVATVLNGVEGLQSSRPSC